jgi:phage FluMu protein Com
MGMFDSVYAKCPKCKADVEFQSKAGECVLERFWVDSVPPAIAVDLDGETVACQFCGSLVRVITVQPMLNIEMRVVVEG